MIIKYNPKKLTEAAGLERIHHMRDAFFANTHQVLAKEGNLVFSSIIGLSGSYIVWNKHARAEAEHLVAARDKRKLDDFISSYRDVDRDVYEELREIVGWSDKKMSRIFDKGTETKLFIVMCSIVGYVVLEPVKIGWAAKSVWYSYVKKPHRGTGLGKKLYDVAITAGQELLAADTHQTPAARKLWLSFMADPRYTVWAQGDKSTPYLLSLVPDDELFDDELEDENGLVESVHKIWYEDSFDGFQDRIDDNVRLYVVARNCKVQPIVRRAKTA